MSIQFAWSRLEFKSWISLLIFCLVDLSNIDNGVLKSPTIIVWESKSLCKSLISLLIFCLIEFKSLCIWVLGSLALVALILLPLYLCCFKIYFIRYENCNSCFFLLSVCLVNLPPSLYFEPLCILACEMGFLDTAHQWVLVFYPICQSVSFN